MSWIKIQEYAKKHKVTPMAVYKKVNRKTIRTKKIKGVTYVEDADNNEADNVQLTDQQQQVNLEWNKIQNEQRKVKLELQQQKLKNLQQDTILKRLKQQSVKQYYRREFSEQVFECLTDSFADLKSFFIQLKLNKEQNEKLKSVFKKAIDKFQKKLTDNLLNKQKEEELNTDNEAE